MATLTDLAVRIAQDINAVPTIFQNPSPLGSTEDLDTLITPQRRQTIFSATATNPANHYPDGSLHGVLDVIYVADNQVNPYILQTWVETWSRWIALRHYRNGEWTPWTRVGEAEAAEAVAPIDARVTALEQGAGTSQQVSVSFGGTDTHIYTPSNTGHHRWRLRRVDIPYTTGAKFENSLSWRLHVINKGTWDGSTFTAGTDLVSVGAWETAIKVPGAADFFGTAHGYEVENGPITAFVDGEPVTPTPGIQLDGEEVRFVTGATLFRQGTESDALATITRDYRWTRDGLTLRQRLEWEQSTAITDAYLVMLPLMRDGVSDRAITDQDGVVYDVSAPGHDVPPTSLSAGRGSVTAWHTTAGHVATVDVEASGAPLTYFVSTSDFYNKIYFSLGSGTTPAVGDVWDVTATYRFAG